MVDESLVKENETYHLKAELKSSKDEIERIRRENETLKEDLKLLRETILKDRTITAAQLGEDQKRAVNALENELSLLREDIQQAYSNRDKMRETIHHILTKYATDEQNK